MRHQDDPTLHLSLSRRRLLITGSTGAIALLASPRVLGHDDDSDNDSDDERTPDDEQTPNDHGGHDDVDDEGDFPPAGTVPAGSVEVRIDDDDADAFQPGTVTIDLGQSVTWVNLDDDEHTATGAAFDTGILAPGALGTVTFDADGSFPYSCQRHPEMVGRVDVRDASGTVPTASPEASPAAASGTTAEVAIANSAFDPPELEVAIGTTVAWANQEAIPHTVTAVDGGFDSGTLEQRDAFSHTFEAAGTFTYVCAFHPSMTGTITVTP
jgi:plastocyanin